MAEPEPPATHLWEIDKLSNYCPQLLHCNVECDREFPKGAQHGALLGRYRRERNHSPSGRTQGRMKMLAEYLENAIRFEKMAADEKDAKLKEHFEKQATAYRKLAEKKAKDYGLKMP